MEVWGCENLSPTYIGNLINYKYRHIIHEEIISVDLVVADRLKVRAIMENWLLFRGQ